MSASLRIPASLCFLILLFVCLPFGSARQKPQKPADPRAQAQAPPAPEEPDLFRIRAGVTEVMAPVTVIGKGGDYLRNLTDRDFALFDNEVRQQITVQPSELPLSLVVMIGNSRRVEPLLGQVQKTGILFTDLLLGQQGEAAVLTYDHRVEVAQDFTHNADEIQKAFRGVKVGSSQARLADALVQGLGMLARRPDGRRKVIVVIGEDRDAGSEMPLEYALRQAQIGGISIYSVGLSYKASLLREQAPPPAPGPFPPGVQAGGTAPQGGIAAQQTAGINGGNFGNAIAIVASGLKDLFVKTPLQGYAKGTGSLHTSSAQKASIEKDIQQISDELHSQYIISYRPNTLSQVGFHEIKVSVGYPVSEVRVRPGYFFLGPPAPASDNVPPTQPK